MPLPSGYTRLQYIKSFGAQYINTGFKPNQDTRVVCKAKTAVGSTTNWLFGVRQSSSAKKFYFAASSLGYYSGGYNAASLTYPVSCNTEGIFVIDANKNVFTLTGEGFTETNETEYSNFTAPSALLLFACNTNGTIGYGSASIYSCRIYDNGTIVRNFIPCKNVSGVVGLYDTVNGLFYSNMGTGTFSAGAEVKPSYKIVDANDLDSAIEASADAVRSKRKVADKMSWSMHDGFSSFIGAISGGSSGGGIKIAEGEFTAVTSTYEPMIWKYPITISGLAFKPSRVIFYNKHGVSNHDGVLMYDSGTNLCVGRWNEEYYDEYEDEYYDDIYCGKMNLEPTVTFTSDGFKVSATEEGEWRELSWFPDEYHYIAIA